MSKSNPTALRLGMSGPLKGRRYTVRGRVVLSMVADDGETYYWNEFNVVDASGSSATLVYEEAEDDSPPWKWFTLLAPRKPLTAAEAAAKRVGDTIEFEGRQIPITLVDETRVVHIEGEAPEDVEVGDVARYFNAEVGDGRMLVASWSGEDIEYYIGRPIHRRQVEAAFGLPLSERAEFHDGESSGFGFTNWIWPAAIGTIIFVALMAGYERSAVAAPPPTLRLEPAKIFSVGDQGRWEGVEFEVQTHVMVEVGAPRRRFVQHEFSLRNVAGNEVLLLHGWLSEPDCVWLEPLPQAPFADAFIAASLKPAATVQIGAKRYTVQTLFLAKGQKREGAPSSLWPQQAWHGFMARNGDEWMLCRWTENSLRCYVGRSIPPPMLLASRARPR